MTYTQPLILLCLLVAFIGLLKLRHCKRKTLVMCGVLALASLSWPPVDWLLSRPLEARYPVEPFSASPPPQAIVVLSSAISPPQFERPYPLADRETFDRCELAVWLYNNRCSVPILLCGGPGGSGKQPYSQAMRDLLIAAGIPESMIWTEEHSHSTHENAVFGSQILKMHGARRIALVVDARSMPRAAACFRKEGIDVIPAPCDFRELGPLAEELLPSWKAIRQNELTLHESLALLWYRLHGWI